MLDHLFYLITVKFFISQNDAFKLKTCTGFRIHKRQNGVQLARISRTS